MGRVPAPQGRNHHHRPVISFKEQLTFINALKFPGVLLPLRLPRYRDWQPVVSETSLTPKLRGMTNIRAPLRHPKLLNFVAARDESTRAPAHPSFAAGRNSSFCQG